MSTQRQGQMSLGAFFLMETGHHVAAWRDPATPANGGLDFKVYKQVVQIAEQARFDMVFFLPIASLPIPARRPSAWRVRTSLSRLRCCRRWPP